MAAIARLNSGAPRSSLESCVVAGLRDRLGELVGVEARVGAERQDLAVARVHGHEGAGLGAVLRGGAHRAGERVVGGALEVEVERDAQALALLGLAPAHLAAVVAAAERVDDHPREAVGPAQVLVVALLDAVGPDPRAGLDAAVALELELLGRDLARGPEQLGAQLVVRVVAQVLLLDLDARELLLALADVVEGGAIDGRADRDVRVRQLGDTLDHALVDRLGLDVDHVAQAAVEAAQLELADGHGRDGHRRGLAGGARQAPAVAALLARGAAAALADVALERAQLVGGRQARPLGLAALLAELVGLLEHRVGQRARDELHHRRHARLDQHGAVAVDDVPARRLDPDLADPVVARLRHVVLARQHLQEPEAEEDDREQHEGEAAEHGDAHRELRRDRRAAFLDGVRHVRAG